MCVRVRNADTAGIEALAASDPSILTRSGHDFFWEAAKHHGQAGDEELAGLLGVLRQCGHLAAYPGSQSLHFFLEQGQLQCAAVVLDAMGRLTHAGQTTWMTGMLRDPTRFDPVRAWDWRTDQERERWQGTLLAGGVLLGTDKAILERLHGSAPEVEPDIISNQIQQWLSLHVVELASEEVSRISPTESSTLWWLDTLGVDRVQMLWKQTAAEHWPSLAQLKAMVDNNILDSATAQEARSGGRPRF